MVDSRVIDTLIAEAAGDGAPGLIAAAWAIQQRAAARGQTIDQVVRSGFDGYSNPGSAAIRAQKDPKLRAQVEQIMNGVQSGSIPNPVPGADHFLSGNVMPSWAKGMKLVATIGGHRFYASGSVPQAAYGRLIPPGELPEVATRTDTVPPRAPAPVTPSLDMALMRKAAMPSNMVADSFGRLPQPPQRRQTMAADLLATEKNQVTPYLTLSGNGITDPAAILMKPDYQSIGSLPTMRPPTPSAPPAPPRPNFNGDPGTPAQGAVVASLPTTGIGQPPSTRAVQSVPVPPRPPSASDLARGNNAYQTIATYPTTPPALTASDRVRAAAIPDRLMPGQAGLPALYGTISPQQVAMTGVPAVGPNAPLPYPGPPTMVAQQQTKVAPIPFPPYRAVGTQMGQAMLPQIPAPQIPQMAQMPPLPLPRPNVGRPAMMPQMPAPRVAPIPQMRPANLQAMGGQPVHAPLRITVNGGNGAMPLSAPPMPPPLTPVQQLQAQGMSPAQAYAMANANAQAAAQAQATSPTHQSSNNYFNEMTK